MPGLRVPLGVLISSSTFLSTNKSSMHASGIRSATVRIDVWWNDHSIPVRENLSKRTYLFKSSGIGLSILGLVMVPCLDATNGMSTNGAAGCDNGGGGGVCGAVDCGMYAAAFANMVESDDCMAACLYLYSPK